VALEVLHWLPLETYTVTSFKRTPGTAQVAWELSILMAGTTIPPKLQYKTELKKLVPVMVKLVPQ